jgi:hypothetical protein
VVELIMDLVEEVLVVFDVFLQLMFVAILLIQQQLVEVEQQEALELMVVMDLIQV